MDDDDPGASWDQDIQDLYHDELLPTVETWLAKSLAEGLSRDEINSRFRRWLRKLR